MTAAELKAMKDEKGISTSQPQPGLWYATIFAEGQSLTPSASFSGPSEEAVVTMAASFLEKVGF